MNMVWRKWQSTGLHHVSHNLECQVHRSSVTAIRNKTKQGCHVSQVHVIGIHLKYVHIRSTQETLIVKNRLRKS